MLRHGKGRGLLHGPKILFAALLVACLCLPRVSGAQDADAGDNDAQATLLEPVKVTAQKKEEDVQDVPISMDVFTNERIEDAGIADMQDLTYFAPNIYAKQNTNQNMVIIRGLSSHNVVLNTPAGLFVDGINYPMTFMQNPDLLDIERVEILRGPQGTLYGRNTESGAINIITRQPDNEARGKVYLEPGFFDAPDRTPFVMRSGFAYSRPLVEDALYAAVAFQSVDSDGYTYNEWNDNDKAGKINHKTGQAKLRWTPSSRWDISLLGNAYEHNDGYGYIHYVDGAAATDPYTINWDGDNRWTDANNGQALQMQYKGKICNLTSITTRNNFRTDFHNDGEFGPAAMGDQDFMFANTSYSQEFRVSSAGDGGPFEWLAGIFYAHDENEALAAFFGNARKTLYDSNGYALFGQGTYAFLERFKLTLGLRYDMQKSQGRQSLNGNPSYSGEANHYELLPKATLSYDLDEDVLLYATVAKGLMAGGYNYAFSNGSATLVFKPETTMNYELGMKSGWLEDRLQVNMAAFYITITDKQVEEFLAGPAARAVTNAAKATSFGFELEAEARPAKGWTLLASLGYADASIDEWVSDTGVDYGGNCLTYAPRYTYNAAVQYDHESGYFGRVDMLGISDFYTNIDNGIRVEGYQVFNLRLGRRSDTFDVALWSKNIFDKRYLHSKSYFIGGNIAEEGAPRSFGTTLTYYF